MEKLLLVLCAPSSFFFKKELRTTQRWNFWAGLFRSALTAAVRQLMLPYMFKDGFYNQIRIMMRLFLFGDFFVGIFLFPSDQITL